MSNKNKAKHKKQEEEQANKVVKVIIVGLIILGLIAIVGASLLD